MKRNEQNDNVTVYALINLDSEEELLSELVKKGIECKMEDGGSFLSWVCRFNKELLLKMLIDSGKDVTVNDNAAVKTAIFYNRKTITKMLIQAGADSKIALKTAVEYNRKEITQMLIKLGVDVTANDNEAIRTQTRKGYKSGNETAKLLIGAGADVTSWNCQALYNAAENDDVELMKTLIEAGTYVKDNTVLIDDEIGNHENGEKVISLLIKAGADPKFNNNIAIQVAAEKGYELKVRAFVIAGVDVTANNNYALRKAAQNGYTHILEILINYGADAAAMNNEAIKLAVKYKHKDCAKILKKAGAKINIFQRIAISLKSY